MQGVSILADAEGKPTFLAVDLQNHDERLNRALGQLLQAMRDLNEVSENQFWQGVSEDALRAIWDTPENEGWDVAFEAWKKLSAHP